MRKQYGQFFTSRETAEFMASLYALPCDCRRLSILDPGAGSGILSIALLKRLLECGFSGHIDLLCYENDPHILPVLEANLRHVSQVSSLDLAWKIRQENYIVSQRSEYNHLLGCRQDVVQADVVIANPPYMKIGKGSAEAQAMADVCHGAPNLYFLFVTMGLFNLREGGELICIIPRSWTSGAYFKRFREKLLRQSALTHIHLFEDREKVFAQENVLQETMIVNVRKGVRHPETITVTTTRNNSDFSQVTTFSAPYETVVSSRESYVYLVTSERQVQTLAKLNQWKNTLLTLGLKMKTGLTVDFRCREMLRNSPEGGCVPLFYSHHLKDGMVRFPTGSGHEYMVTDKAGLLQRNINYLFVKRFTSKEEKRRLQCGVYLARNYPEFDRISTQNKLNFITGMKELSECLVFGLYVLFNSRIYDDYYRILNGSTQVNSTEMNTLPMPELKTIEAMGRRLLQDHNMSESSCDEIIGGYL